jgi:hypothetical protein
MSELVIDLRWSGSIPSNSLAAVSKAIESYPHAAALILRPAMTLRPDGGESPWILLLGEADAPLRQQLLLKPHDELIFSKDLTFPDMDPFFALFSLPGMNPGPELWIEPDPFYEQRAFLRALINDIPQDHPARIRLLVPRPWPGSFPLVMNGQPGNPHHLGLIYRFSTSLFFPSIRRRSASRSPWGRFLGYEIVPIP